ncbi:MAG: penicillin-binding protein activator LpoB [Treponema sp.]|nr:penicillin-binding protein activator LpoB [Treponema sp.]
MFGKRLFGVWVLFFAVIFLFVSCVTKNNKNEIGIVSLDKAIQLAAVEIGENVGSGQKIALLNFNSPSVDFSEYVLDELEIQLVRSKKFVVVDRRELDLIRKEVNYQRSGEVSDESAQSIGKQLGAQVIVSGSLNIIGNIYRFRIRVLNVESAAIESAPSADINPTEEKTINLLSVKQQTPGVIPVISEAKGTYKIGDTGLAGGIVFYDKGGYSDGWRYLEAAPASS